MKVQLTEITTRPVEYELPEVCPFCAADFRQPKSLIEEGWIGCSDRCRIADNPDDGPELEDYDDPEEFTDLRITTGFSCAKCQKALVELDVQREEPSGNGQPS
jgi:hypothetical protein